MPDTKPSHPDSHTCDANKTRHAATDAVMDAVKPGQTKHSAEDATKSHTANGGIAKHAATNGADKTSLATPTRPAGASIPDPTIDTGHFSWGIPSFGAVPKHALERDIATAPPLGVLAKFTGTFAGTGFNQIFRPNSGPPTTTTFDTPVFPPPPIPPSESVLELNLTTETLHFSKSLGTVPNRGLGDQNDIMLNGVPYVQAIKDVTNVTTGKADGEPVDIHFEPGLWMNVPETLTAPILGNSLVRMASIPHGTTINAQCLTEPIITKAAPDIAQVDITPFGIGGTPPPPLPIGSNIPPPNAFPAQDASNQATPRLPQDLRPFIDAGTINQEILTDPNTILRNAIKGQNIIEAVTFTVSTNQLAPKFGGGAENIAFLDGNSNESAANATAAEMESTFWVETVQHELDIPTWKRGDPPVEIDIPGSILTFVGTPTHDITEPRKIVVTSTQIQYSQKVLLNFAGLSWPHVSVATLVPRKKQTIPESAWN